MEQGIENILSRSVIEAPRELGKVAIQMLDRDVMKRPNDTALQESLKALDGVGVDRVVNKIEFREEAPKVTKRRLYNRPASDRRRQTNHQPWSPGRSSGLDGR